MTTTDPYTRTQARAYLIKLLDNSLLNLTYFEAAQRRPDLENIIKKLSHQEVVLLTELIESKL